MRWAVAVLLLTVGFGRPATGQELIVGPAAYGQYVTGDLSEFGRPLMAEPLYAQGPNSNIEIGVGAGRTRVSGDDIRTQDGLGSFQLTVGIPLGLRAVRFSYRQTDRELALLRRVTAGWLMEFGRRSWRPFLEPGWTFSSQSPGAVASGTMTGPHVSTGLTVDLTERLFVRPELSADLQLRGPMLLREAWLAVGLRF